MLGEIQGRGCCIGMASWSQHGSGSETRTQLGHLMTKLTQLLLASFKSQPNVTIPWSPRLVSVLDALRTCDITNDPIGKTAAAGSTFRDLIAFQFATPAFLALTEVSSSSQFPSECCSLPCDTGVFRSFGSG